MTDSKDSKGGERKRGRTLNSNCIYVYHHDAAREALARQAAAEHRSMQQQSRHNDVRVLIDDGYLKLTDL